MDNEREVQAAPAKQARPNNNNRKRKKVCQFCADKTAKFIDYKDAAKLRKFTQRTTASTNSAATVPIPARLAIR